MKRRIVITGIGPLAANGMGKADFWSSVLLKKVNIQKEDFIIDDELIDSYFLHKISNLDLGALDIDEESLEAISQWKNGDEDVDLCYFLAVIRLALQDSGLKYNHDGNKIALVLGHGNPGLEQFWEKNFNDTYAIFQNNKCLKKKEYFEIFYKTFVKNSYDLQAYMYLFHIAKTFHFHGHQLYLNNACSSGLFALEAASELIKSRKSNIVFIASAGRSRYYKYRWFRDTDYPYAEDGLIKPFDKNANGLVLGDGGVGMVIEDLEHALARKAKIYGEYLGGSFNAESWKVTLPAVNDPFYENAIRGALTFSDTKAEEIDLINPHGTGLRVVDKYEARAINSVFKNCRPSISAFKPYIGHCIGGSALIEAAILLLSLKEDIIPATLNYREPDVKMNLNVVSERTNKKLNKVMKTCCAIAGFNAAVVFGKYKD
jgi:3-oxoacyl-(acyl-carrier-protein) synthase